MIDGMTLDQLRAFSAVAETGSFSAAARRLGRVHSAISQSVATLEDQLGVLLFERGGRTPVLSEAGRVLLADARRVLGEARALKARAAAMGPDIENELTLAVDGYFPAAVLMEGITALREAFPKLFGDRWEAARDVFYDAYRSVHLERIEVIDGACHVEGCAVVPAARPAGQGGG